MNTSGRRGFALLAVIFAAYACVYILRLSFVVNGVRYFTLADDQMISMRYAENLAAGYGLVWNPGGPRVEGYTNCLWVLYMAVFHWLKVPRPVISACVQMSGGLFLLLNLFFVKRIAWRISGGSTAATLSAVGLVAFYIPLDNWAFQGTEVSVLTLMVTAGVWRALHALDSPRLPIGLFLLLGVTTLVRPDMVVFAAAILIGLAILEPRSAPARLLAGLTIVGAFVAAETAFRLLYFGNPLPNTYYLKMAGFPLLQRLSRGFITAGVFCVHVMPLLIPIGMTGILRDGSREIRLLLGVFGSQVAYSIFVGGDAWEWWGGSNRFIAITMPLLFICAAVAFVQFWARFSNVDRLRALGRRKLAASMLPVAIAINVALVNYLALSVAADPGGPVRRMFLLVKPHETDSDEQYVRAALALREVTDDSAVVAVVWAGAIPYFSQRQAIDLLGKMDPRIAHAPMHQPDPGHEWTGFLPGHLKWDYAYSIGQLEPDVIQAPLWNLDYVEPEPTPYLERDYERAVIVAPWYLRRESGHVRWDAVRLKQVSQFR